MTSDRTRSGFEARAAASAASPSADRSRPDSRRRAAAARRSGACRRLSSASRTRWFSPSLRQLGQVLQFRASLLCRQPGHGHRRASSRLLHIGLRPHAGRCARAAGLHAVGRQMVGAERQANGEGAAVADARSPRRSSRHAAGPAPAPAPGRCRCLRCCGRARPRRDGSARTGAAARPPECRCRCRAPRPRPPCRRRRPDLNGDFALEGELERVGEKVEDDLLPHVAVDIDRRRQAAGNRCAG